MKNKIILIIALAGAALAYHFQDKLFNNQPANVAAVKDATQTPEDAPAPRVRSNDPINVEIVVIDKKHGQYQDAPADLEKLTSGLNKIFEYHRSLTFNVYYNYYKTFEEVPAEKWDANIVITRTLAALELIKQEKGIKPLLYVSPTSGPCYQEVQVGALYDANIGSIADLSNKVVFVESLKGVNNLPLRRFMTEEDFAPRITVTDLSIEAGIDQLFQKSADAAVFPTGLFSSLNQTANNFRIFKTSDYKIPCYTLFLNKRMPEDTTATIKERLLFVGNDPELVKMLKPALGIEHFEDIPPKSIEDLMAMAKKYEKAEIKTYSPPLVEEKAAETSAKPADSSAPADPNAPNVPNNNATNTAPLTPDQLEMEKQKALLVEMKEQQEKQMKEIKAQQERQEQARLQQEKQQQEIKLQQERLQQQQKAVESPNSQFKTPQELLQQMQQQNN